MSRDITPFGLRMPIDLREALNQVAKKNRRSLNSEIVERLLSTFVEAQEISHVDKTREGRQTNLRFPQALWDRIEALAAESRRTVTSQVVYMLEAFLDDLDAVEAGEEEVGEDDFDAITAANQLRNRLPTAAAASYLGMSASNLNKLRSEGKGPKFIRLGSRVFYMQRDLDAYVESSMVNTTSTR